MSFHRSFYVNFVRFSRMILLLKLCMKKALISFRGTNHRQEIRQVISLLRKPQATKTEPKSEWPAEPGAQPEDGRRAHTDMPLFIYYP